MTDEAMRALEVAGVVEPEGAGLLDDLARFLGCYVAFPTEEARDAAALWTLHTHALDAFESTPRLALLSPEKGSGKTRTLEVLDVLVPRPMHAVNLSAAALFRQVSNNRPTLLMDEADTYLGLRVAKDHEELRGLVNAGHRRGAVAYRCVGEPAKMQVVEFPAFAAVALAAIGDIPDTIVDRSIVVRMRRRAPSEHVEPFRLRKVKPHGEALRSRCEAWATANLERLTSAEPTMPKGIVDRPADVWEALIAVADAAGEHWPQRARRACVELNAVRQQADPSLGVQLLESIRQVFEQGHSDKLSTEDLVAALCDLEEAPWGDLRGKPIDARGVARRLRAFEVRPKKIRLGERTACGYESTDLYDAWQRYLPPSSLESAEQAERWNNSRSEAPASVPLADTVPPTTGTGNGSGTESEPSTSDVPSVPHVPSPEGSKAETRPEPWRFPGDIAACVVCGSAARSLDTEGRRRHPMCALVPEGAS